MADKESRYTEWLKAFPVDLQGLYEKANEHLPHSAKRWWWCWGGVVGLLFGVQAVTGLLLAFYYRAEPETAYNSVKYITEHARYGCFIRSIHQWGANLMIITLFLHMLRVFVTAAFRNFRWGAWMVGVALLSLTLGFGFTGYSLVYEQLSYWAITVTSNIMGEIPLLGSGLKQFFLAGETINSATLSRLYALHVQILPAVLITFILIHLFFIRLFGMHIPGNTGDVEVEKKLTEQKGPYHFIPNHVLGETAVFMYLLVIIFLLALLFPAKMGMEMDPLVTPEHIKPEWYFYAFFHLLKLVPGSTGVLILIGSFALIFLWPIVDHYLLQKIDKSLFKGRFETSLIFGFIAIAFYVIFALLESY